MTMLSSVDMAPWTTGAIISSSAICVRRLRPPMLVTKPCSNNNSVEAFCTDPNTNNHNHNHEIG